MRDKEYRAANKERIAAQKKLYREANQERIAAYRRHHRAMNGEILSLRNKAWRAANHEMMAVYYRERDLRKLYGLTLEEMMAISEQCQNPDCKRPITRKNGLCVDHDHTTGAIRGILCNVCNLRLGKFGDSLEHLKDGAPAWMRQYLEGAFVALGEEP